MQELTDREEGFSSTLKETRLTSS